MHLFAWIDPVLFRLGPLTVRWYGVMYAISFILAYVWFYYSRPGKNLPLDQKQKDTFLFSGILGVLLGGRLGYILFYNLPFYLANPLKIFAVWEGGMSFHGGVVGVTIALLWFWRKYKVDFWKLADVVAGIVPVGVGLVRIGNFINGELYGRVAENFCLYFPTDPENCRYPSQLLQAGLEGLALFLILHFVSRKNPTPGTVSSLFLILYGVFRIIAEFFREPDVQLGYLWWGFTQGQALSVLMIVGGMILSWIVRKEHKS